SLGMGAIITYSASVSDRVNISKTALIVAFFDTLIALVAGLIIFTLLFQFGEEPSKGPGLVFISMPVIFSQMGGVGYFLSLLFLIALAMAGLTSAVSLVEPAVLYVINRFGLTRFKATILMGSIYWFIGIFAILSYSNSYGEFWSFFGKPLFDIFETTTDSLLLPLSGVIIAVVVGYIIKRENLNKISSEMGGVFSIWYISIRFIAPIAVIFLMLNLFGIIEL
ncbi:MAG TPA: sodium-dependent transporter, partial [Campylobacterales bacterium]|nr:sodium-dependent transporter [Campylobacterales bacterium]